jgi:hypothetical protein
VLLIVHGRGVSHLVRGVTVRDCSQMVSPNTRAKHPPHPTTCYRRTYAAYDSACEGSCCFIKNVTGSGDLSLVPASGLVTGVSDILVPGSGQPSGFKYSESFAVYKGYSVAGELLPVTWRHLGMNWECGCWCVVTCLCAW